MTHLMPYPLRPDTPLHLLDGTWDATFLGDVDPLTLDPTALSFTHRIPVPSALDCFPDWQGMRGVFALRTTYNHTEGLGGVLRLAGTGMWNKILISDDQGQTYTEIGKVAFPYCPVSFTLPSAGTCKRELVVLCDNRFNFDTVPLQSEYFDFYAYGGLFRSITVQETGDWWIDRVQIRTESIEAGRLHLRVLRKGDCSTSVAGSITVDGIPAAELEFGASETEKELTVSIPGLTPWTPEDPALHVLELTLDGQRIQERFGLRTVEVQGHQILLNGKSVVLKGFCRHEAHPQFGPALPHAQLTQDLQLLRSMGCNFVRGSHYPQDPRFLDLCDELGMLVFEESLGWGQPAEELDDAGYRDACEEQTRLMVQSSINHPSILIWGFLNEGASESEAAERIYPRLAAAIREEDASRLVTYATNRPYRDEQFGICDVISVNIYPAWYGSIDLPTRPLDQIGREFDKLRQALKDHPGATGKPLIISEIGAGAIYGWRDPHQAHWSEEYQADFLETFLTEFQERKEMTGFSLWQFCDCRTYSNPMALRRPRAFNNKGVYDEYRRPKLAVEVVRRMLTHPDSR